MILMARETALESESIFIMFYVTNNIMNILYIFKLMPSPDVVLIQHSEKTHGFHLSWELFSSL